MKLKEQAQQWLVEWFRNHRKIGKHTPEQLIDLDFLEAGMLSSMEIVELITEVENNFGIQFLDADFQDARLVKISGLAELIAERATQAV